MDGPRLEAASLIERLGLVPLPDEGGHYRETWRAKETAPAGTLPVRYRGDRSFGTAILYLLTSDPDSFSALHHLPTDEVYHFYLGDPVEMLLLYPDGRSETVALGHDVLGAEKVQFVVPRGVWQGSRVAPGGSWSLLGTTMAPGFEFADYEAGDRDELVAGYPEAAGRIRALTREPSPGSGSP
ncbi:MAG TPA: cupin domain-containing protein [Gemmatimonadota bacterium]|nr:cupin domain-containing protein [Gemmatimonadota bacterium]